MGDARASKGEEGIAMVEAVVESTDRSVVSADAAGRLGLITPKVAVGREGVGSS